MSTHPNVLTICVDHWTGSLLGSAGHPCIQTPTLDSLAATGVRFTNAYSECPVCVPARRTMMTGTTPRTHEDRVFKSTARMPPFPTLAQCFRNAGYQAYAVGKLHVYPQRDRIGFDDVILLEEARYQFRAVDDYQTYLAEQGYTGQESLHGMSNNEYITRPWHLPEEHHQTNWATREMIRQIKRRDPTRPAFYYLSYNYPHPPLVPLQCYLDLYADEEIDLPYYGDWYKDNIYPVRNLTYPSKAMNCYRGPDFQPCENRLRAIRRAFYAQCTHIDHQLRLVIGTLREEGLLDNTILLFTCDHGDMLGNHRMWAKRVFYENSAHVPMLLSSLPGDNRVAQGVVDRRLVGLQDVMPTLLDLCNIPIPESVDGLSMVGDTTRDWLYGEINEDELASRMVHDGRYKLIYYPVGNYAQLFDLQDDPNELRNLAGQSGIQKIQETLTQILMSQLYNGDEAWIQNGQLVGLPDKLFEPKTNRGLHGQRGGHWPPPSYTPEAFA